MENRLVEKEIELENRKFVIKKFDPMFGSYISLKILQNAESQGKFNVQEALVKIMGEDFAHYNQLQSKILGFCSEILPAGRIPIINSEGNIAVIGLTAPMMLALSVSTIMFSLEDFFEKEEREQIMEQTMEALAPQPQ